MNKLLLLEDDRSLIYGLSFALKKQGFEVDIAKNLCEAETLWAERTYHLLILDVFLPDGSGFDFCKKVRSTSSVPIIFLTASDEEVNIVMGLDIGADDYITKPFKLGIFLSRINALLRRAEYAKNTETTLESNGIELLLSEGSAYKDGELLDLTAGEYKLLGFFMRHPNAVLSKEQILENLWDGDEHYIDNSAISVYIRRLRVKIEDDPGEPKMILTVRKMGYKWNVYR
ncbi:MAG: response regulator transcription factor [Peptoniphilus sp.]|nr:response regulator transcription factor [Peptoniphilus sp.]MDD7362670.1 response regulator transcription factor [Bacillota bacterium]MDY6044931.1 response regulator transcription factor [Peptoniphilus sp.]